MVSSLLFASAPAEAVRGSYSDSFGGGGWGGSSVPRSYGEISPSSTHPPPPAHPASPSACSFLHPFALPSLHCCFRFFRYSCIFSCLHWLRRCAARLSSLAQSTCPFVFISCPVLLQTGVPEPAFHFNCFVASSLSSAVQFFLAHLSFVLCLSSHPFNLSVRRRAALTWHQQFVGPLCLRPGRSGRREASKWNMQDLYHQQ